MSVTRQGYKTAQDVYLLGGEVTIAGANSAGGAINTNIASTDIMQPVDIQSHYQTTIQTHNAVSVATVTISHSAWIDTNGFDKVAITMLNSAATSSYIDLYWSNDGINVHGANYSQQSSTALSKAFEIPTQARYLRISLYNANTASNTMSAWAYLKA
jgi:hypothetical protein